MTRCAVVRLGESHCAEPVAHAYERTVTYMGTIDETRGDDYAITDLFLCESHAATWSGHLRGYREVPLGDERR